MNSNQTPTIPRETSLQFLRDILPFGRAVSEDKAVAEVRAALDGLSALNPQPAAVALAGEIIPGIARHGNLHMRLKLLEEARTVAERPLTEIEARLENAPLPLGSAATALALVADNVLKALAAAYSGIALGIERRRVDSGLARLQAAAVRHACQTICRRQNLAYRAYAVPSASSWQMLHKLFRVARNRRVTSRNGGEAPIDHLYAGALLLAAIDPTKFPRGTLNALNKAVDALAPLGSIAEADADFHIPKSAAGQFVIRGDDGTPGHPLLRTQLATSLGGCLIVDFRPVLAMLDRHLRKLPDEAPCIPLELPDAFVQAMRTALGSHAARRYSRTRFKPRADLAAGIDAVIDFLNGRALTRRSTDPGREERHWPVALSEWSLLDESPEGFGIRYLKGEKSRIEAGEVVALQPRENSKLHICMVRRITSTEHHRLELGLQELSGFGVVIDIPQAVANYVEQAIVIPRLPGHANATGILARPGSVKCGQRVSFRDAERQLRYTVGASLERHPRVELYALEPLAG